MERVFLPISLDLFIQHMNRGLLFCNSCRIRALETHRKDDDTKWLTYWVVFASFGVVESFTDIFLYWIPLYSLLKCGLFLFLMIPTTPNGSIILYNKLIRPYFLAYQGKIDSVLDKAADIAGDFSNIGKC